MTPPFARQLQPRRRALKLLSTIQACPPLAGRLFGSQLDLPVVVSFDPHCTESPPLHHSESPFLPHICTINFLVDGPSIKLST